MKKFIKVGRNTIELKAGNHIIMEGTELRFINEDTPNVGPLKISKASFEKFRRIGGIKQSYKKHEYKIATYFTYSGE